MTRSLKVIEAHVNNVTYLFIKYLIEISGVVRLPVTIIMRNVVIMQ